MKTRVYRNVSWAAAASGAILLGSALAQNPATAPAPAAASDVGAISLPATVVDGHGDPVKDLTAADLVLVDNGQKQAIQSFTPDQPSQMTVGLIGETGSGLRSELGDERLSAVHFVDHNLPGVSNKAFVIQYDREVDLLADPTATVNKLHDAINQIGSPAFGNSGGDNGGNSGDNGQNGNGGENQPHFGGSSVGGTLYDAIYLASTLEMKGQPGRHILVVVTDGVDRDSKETLADAVDAAQTTHTAIFAIYYKPEEEQQRNPNQNGGHRGGASGPGFPGGGGGWPGSGGGGYPRSGGSGQSPSQQPAIDGREILEHICNETGGYMVEGKHDKGDDAYSKVTALLGHQYTLTFVPDKDTAGSTYQRLNLTTNKKDVWAIVPEAYTTAPQ
jgi:VWFA-related protein